MGKKASKTLIGAFILGAAFLIIAGVVIFGSGILFAKTQKYVMFFEGSVHGLQVGAPVMFRGAKIGQVTDIQIKLYEKEVVALIPVFIEINMKAITFEQRYPKHEDIKVLIEKGLRAQLKMQSFVTGQLFVDLDFYPDKPAKLVGTEPGYDEIPTIPTAIQDLTKTVQELVIKIDRAVDGIDRLVNSPELKETVVSLNRTVKDVDSLTKSIDSKVVPVASDIQKTLEEARGALAQARKTLAMEEGVPAEVAQDVRNTLKAAQGALDEAKAAAVGVRRVADDNSYELNKTLQEISALSRSLRSLADYLDTHPEALIKGRQPSDGE